MSCSWSRHRCHSSPPPPRSRHPGELGAQCAPRKRGCWVLPLGLPLAAFCGWSWHSLCLAAWRVSEMAEGRQDSSCCCWGEQRQPPGWLQPLSSLRALLQPGHAFSSSSSSGWKGCWAVPAARDRRATLGLLCSVVLCLGPSRFSQHSNSTAGSRVGLAIPSHLSAPGCKVGFQAEP